MATAVEAFGLAALDVKLLIDWMRADLASSNAGVRNGAIALLGTAHRQLGPGLAPMLAQHVKPALMATLEAAFKANPVAQVHRFAYPLPCSLLCLLHISTEACRTIQLHMSEHIRTDCFCFLTNVVLKPWCVTICTLRVPKMALCRWCPCARSGAGLPRAQGRPGRRRAPAQPRSQTRRQPPRWTRRTSCRALTSAAPSRPTWRTALAGVGCRVEP